MSDAHTIHRDLLEGKNANWHLITDPGTGKTIDVTNSGGVCLLTIAASASETRSLPTAANFGVGVELTVVADTVGANSACQVNGSAANGFTFLTAGDRAVFVITEAAGTRSWVLDPTSSQSVGGGLRSGRTPTLAGTGNFTAASGIDGIDVFQQLQSGSTGGGKGGSYTLTAGNGAGDGAAGSGGSISFVTGSASPDSVISGSIMLRVPVGLGGYMLSQGAPDAETATFTATIAKLLTRLITVTSAGAVAVTLDTGANMDAEFDITRLGVDMAFDWGIINLGSSSGVVTVGGGSPAGHTYVGLATVSISTSASFRSRRTAANTWITYRLGS